MFTDPKDRGSGLGIYLAQGIAPLAAILQFGYRSELHPPPVSLAVGVGLAAIVGGLAVRLWAIRTLGRFFTSTVMVQSGQTVVEAGPYRVLRHPSFPASSGPRSPRRSVAPRPSSQGLHRRRTAPMRRTRCARTNAVVTAVDTSSLFHGFSRYRSTPASFLAASAESSPAYPVSKIAPMLAAGCAGSTAAAPRRRVSSSTPVIPGIFWSTMATAIGRFSFFQPGTASKTACPDAKVSTQAICSKAGASAASNASSTAGSSSTRRMRGFRITRLHQRERGPGEIEKVGQARPDNRPYDFEIEFSVVVDSHIAKTDHASHA